MHVCPTTDRSNVNITHSSTGGDHIGDTEQVTSMNTLYMSNKENVMIIYVSTTYKVPLNYEMKRQTRPQWVWTYQR